MLPGGAWTTGALTLVLILVAAKAHGRQVRLARVRLGVGSVDFRGDNGPVVEALWKRDKTRFWVADVLLLAGGIASTLVDPPSDWAPLWGIVGWLFWAFAGAFVVSGLLEFVDLLRARADDDAVWRRHAVDSSVGWWLLAVMAAALVALSVA